MDKTKRNLLFFFVLILLGAYLGQDSWFFAVIIALAIVVIFVMTVTDKDIR